MELDRFQGGAHNFLAGGARGDAFGDIGSRPSTLVRVGSMMMRGELGIVVPRLFP